RSSCCLDGRRRCDLGRPAREARPHTGREGEPVMEQTSVSPELSVRRGLDALAVYKAALGAVEIYRVCGTKENEDVVAQLRVGNATFWVSDESPPNQNFSPESLGGSTVRLLLVVQDPRTVVERAVALGAMEVATVEEAHGWLLGRIEDPFG